MASHRVFSPYEFLEDFLEEAKKAKDSIYLQSMNFEAGDVLAQIEKVLLEALNRGVRVNINHDWVSQVFVKGDLPLLPSPSSKKRLSGDALHRKSKELEENLKAHGATLMVTNKPNLLNRLFPMVRRNHIKMYIVDQKIVWMGGVNLFDDAFSNIDIMIRFEDEKIVKAFTKQFFMIDSLQSPVDYHLKVSDTETLYVDSGKLGESCIYDQALQQIAQAKKRIVYMSQFVPDAKLLSALLHAAKRKVRIDIFISPPQSILFRTFPTSLAYTFFKRKVRKYPQIVVTYKPKNVHAKVIVVDDEVALVGSHNYTYSGVLFGTEEVMLMLRDLNLVSKITQFVEESK